MTAKVAGWPLGDVGTSAALHRIGRLEGTKDARITAGRAD